MRSARPRRCRAAARGARLAARLPSLNTRRRHAEDGDEDRNLHTGNCSTKARECHIFPAWPSTRNCSKFSRVRNCKTPVTLVKNGTALKCATCHRVYPIKDDIPVMLIDEATIEPWIEFDSQIVED